MADSVSKILQGSEPVPVPVEYDTIEDYETHVVGIMSLKGTDGHGEFEFRVSGQRADVENYAEEAVIQRLTLRELQEGEDPFAEWQSSILERRRDDWLQWLEGRCQALHDLIGEADLRLLGDLRELSVRLGLELFTFDKPLVFPEHREPDLTRDRLCEIRPTGLDDGVEDEFEFVMHFQVHPGVSQGRRDIYVSSRNSTGVSANLTCVSGDPDLYLARGGDPIDSSTRGTGSDESVSGSWGSGKWRVHVYGYTTAQYQLSAGWVYDKTKTGLPPAFGG